MHGSGSLGAEQGNRITRTVTTSKENVILVPTRNRTRSAGRGECQAVVFRHGLQLFGAMGFTWENDLQFALKRAKAGELLLDGAAEHRATIAEEFDAADF